MAILGYNLQKGELHFCPMDGAKADPRYVARGRHRIDAGQPKREAANSSSRPSTS